MEQYNMKANFYPATEPKNGYLGFADLTISNAIRIRGIAVFEDREGDGHHIQFPEYGEGETRGSYIIPSSKEAYAQMLGVIESAMNDPENHFGWVTGKMNPELQVSGRAVTEPYADGRFSVNVADICTLRGVATREVNYEKDGKAGHFVSVDVPVLTPYERDGEKVYPPVFEGLKSKYERDGQEQEKDFGLLMRNLVLAERKKVLEKHEDLDKQIEGAEQKAAGQVPAQQAPEKEATR